MMLYDLDQSMHSASVVTRGGSAYVQSVAQLYKPIHEVRGRLSPSRYRVVSNDGLLRTKPVAQAMAHKVLPEKNSWQKYVFDPHAPTDVDSLTETVEAALDRLAAYGLDGMNFHGMDPNNVQGEHLAAVLRATSTWKESLPGWRSALKVAELALVREGVDPKDALFGMI